MKSGMMHLLAMTVAVLTGCGGSPTVSYYTLRTAGLDETVPQPPAEKGSTIAVGPVGLPEVVDRPQFVLRVGANEVVLVEEHRWAESLASAIPRLIAEHLTRLLHAQGISAYPQSAIGKTDYRVTLDIQRFESELRGAATIDVIWSIHDPASKAASNRTGQSVVREPAAGDGYAALVAAHSRALLAVSRDIAAAIRSSASLPR
jgi:uncharacterized protein